MKNIRAYLIAVFIIILFYDSYSIAPYKLEYIGTKENSINGTNWSIFYFAGIYSCLSLFLLVSCYYNLLILHAENAKNQFKLWITREFLYIITGIGFFVFAVIEIFCINMEFKEYIYHVNQNNIKGVVLFPYCFIVLTYCILYYIFKFKK
jgi:hypothetical protein